MTMSLQKRICEAFCAEVRVNPIRGGFGISTPFSDAATGDGIGFYILGPSDNQMYKLVDDALTVARFEAEGATLDSQQRLESFNEVLTTYGARYDEDSGELLIEDVRLESLDRKILDFMALMLRLQDMYLLTRERTRNTFADDVANKLENLNVPGVSVEANAPVYEDLNEVIPDYVLRREGHKKPLALFLASTSEKLWQAMHLQLIAEHEARKPVSVVALLETGHTGTAKVRDKAANRLAATLNWRGDEAAAFQRILRELEVPSHQLH
jgi:hypothetical protein